MTYEPRAMKGRADKPRLLCQLYAVIIWLGVADGVSVDEQSSSKVYQVPDEQRLYRDLMGAYEPSVRPVINSSTIIEINFRLTLNQIVDLDERKQVLTTNVFIDQEWKDENLSWDPDEFNGIKTLRIPANNVWLPDTFIFNNADDGSTGFMQGVYVLLNYNGTVLWPVPVKLKSSCKVDITYFPFDDQLCALRFGSWIYSGSWMDFQSSLNTVDLRNYIDNSEWELVAMRFKKKSRSYACCPEPHPDLTYTLHIRRRTFYYLFNIIVPCIMLSILTLLTFWLPTTSGEKISLGLSVFLAFSMFMLLIAEEVPATSESVPLIGIYLTTVMTMTSISVIMSVMVINLYNRGHRSHRAPHWLKTIILGGICKVLCVKHDTERLAKGIRLEEEEEARYQCPYHPNRNLRYSPRMTPLLPRSKSSRFQAKRTDSYRKRQPRNFLSVPPGGDPNTYYRYSDILDEYPNNNHHAQKHEMCDSYVNEDAVDRIRKEGAAANDDGVNDDDDDEEEPIWQKRNSFQEQSESLMKRRRDMARQEQRDSGRAAASSHQSYLTPPALNHYDFDEHRLFQSDPSNGGCGGGGGGGSSGSCSRETTAPQPQASSSAEPTSSSSNAELVGVLCRKQKALADRKEVVAEWQTLATVIDRLLFWLFLVCTIVAYVIILICIPYTKPAYPDDFTPVRMLTHKNDPFQTYT